MANQTFVLAPEMSGLVPSGGLEGQAWYKIIGEFPTSSDTPHEHPDHLTQREINDRVPVTFSRDSESFPGHVYWVRILYDGRRDPSRSKPTDLSHTVAFTCRLQITSSITTSLQHAGFRFRR
jgi:hypothetical protein